MTVTDRVLGALVSLGEGRCRDGAICPPSFCLLTMCHQASVNLSAPSGQGVALGAGPQPLSEQMPRKRWVN